MPKVLKLETMAHVILSAAESNRCIKQSNTSVSEPYVFVKGKISNTVKKGGPTQSEAVEKESAYAVFLPKIEEHLKLKAKSLLVAASFRKSTSKKATEKEKFAVGYAKCCYHPESRLAIYYYIKDIEKGKELRLYFEKSWQCSSCKEGKQDKKRKRSDASERDLDGEASDNGDSDEEEGVKIIKVDSIFDKFVKANNFYLNRRIKDIKAMSRELAMIEFPKVPQELYKLNQKEMGNLLLNLGPRTVPNISSVQIDAAVQSKSNHTEENSVIDENDSFDSAIDESTTVKEFEKSIPELPGTERVSRLRARKIQK